MLEDFPPLFLTRAQRVRAALALSNEKGRQADYRGTDHHFDAAGLGLTGSRYRVGQYSEAHAPGADQDGASRAAETGGKQHNYNVKYRDRKFRRRDRLGDEDSCRECRGRDREQRCGGAPP